MEPKKILFVCTGNTCRSSMAEGLAKKVAAEKGWPADQLIFLSAGIEASPKAQATEQAIAAMEGLGVDLHNHKATLLTPELIEEASLVLTMTAAHKARVQEIAPWAQGKIFTLAEFAEAGSDIDDPFGGTIDVYRRCADELYLLVKQSLEKMLAARNEKKEKKSSCRNNGRKKT